MSDTTLWASVALVVVIVLYLVKRRGRLRKED